MNDDEVSVRAEAASAYLDGELDAAERASVAADPEAMALVEKFMQLRHTLGEIDAVADDVRASAITAALAEFDVRQKIGAAAPVPARVTSLPTRWQRAYRVLGGVAAAAVIAVVAVAALNATTGSDSKSSSETAPVSDANAPRIEMAAGSAPAGAAAPAATTAAAGTTAPPGAASDKMAAAELPAVNNADDLAQYASAFVATAAATSEAPRAGATPTATEMVPVPATPPTACLTSTDTVLGPISVVGAPAWAVRDTSTGVVRAIDPNDCRVLLSTGP